MTNKISKYFLVFCLFVIATTSQAERKKVMVLPTNGVTDPHLRYIDGKFWLFAGNDVDPLIEDWIMPFWSVYSSKDLVFWNLETNIGPEDNYMEDGSEKCWAPDAIARNGKTYFYFSNHNKDTGVMVADSPAGPYKDVLKKPMIPSDLTPGMEFDPTVFIDDDKKQTPYVVFGYQGRGGYYIARLKDSMTALAEKPKLLEIKDDIGLEIDKNFLHKHGDTYYLSAGGYYATSKNVYGPYKYRGLVGEGHGLGGYSHGSFLDHKGQTYHVWTRYYNRNKNRYRETLITYAHYNKDGSLNSDTRYLDTHKAWGVANYDRDWNKIEAEWFFESENAMKKQAGDKHNYIVASKGKSTTLYFPSIGHFPKEKRDFIFRARSGDKAAYIAIYENAAKKRLLGKCKIANKQFEEVKCTVEGSTLNSVDLALSFESAKSKKKSSIELDWFRIR